VIIISDTSAIINLAAIDQLELLHTLFQEIIIPPAVYNEITAQSKDQPGSGLTQFPFIKVSKLPNTNFAEALKLELDDGEAEAIALAVELKSDLLLIDEHKGREIAEKFDLKYIGVLGILIEAKQKKHIKMVKPHLDALKSKAGFWINSELYKLVLKTAGE